jgi:predicted Zn-dependent protease
MKHIYFIVVFSLIFISVNGQFTLNLKGKYTKKGQPVELVEIRATDQNSGKAILKTNGKEEANSMSDLKDIDFIVTNSLEFWQNQAIKHEVYDNLLKHGGQYDLRKECEDEALNYLAKIERSNLVFNDDYFENYIYSVIYKLYPGTLNDGRPGVVNIKIIKDLEPNAFIYPNGTLVLSTGLISSFNSEEELIAVISHEVAHFVLDHTVININKAIKRQKSAEFWTALATGLAASADIYAASKNPYYTPGALTIGTAILSSTIASQVIERLGMKYSQDQEKEADECAVELLKFNKIDPLALSSALSKIKKYCLLTGNYMALSGGGTHPSLNDRIKTIGSPKNFNSSSYDKMVSFITSYNAIIEYNNKHFKACQSLVNRNIEAGVPTEDDYLLKAMTNLCLFDNIEKNSEALELIKKAKSLNVSPNININKQEALVLIRLGQKNDAIAALESYMINVKELQSTADKILNQNTWSATQDFVEIEKDWTSKMIYKVKSL